METVHVYGKNDEAYTTYYRNYGDSIYADMNCRAGKVLVMGINDSYGTFIYRTELNAGIRPFNHNVNKKEYMPSGNYCVCGYIKCNSIFYGKDEGTFSWYKK
ncbi:MAG: hypothetical protein K6F17_03000 [Lachnospiraceae bacterium]|nr:hypothetical protein [Lachnospiraceae bacterium]